MRMRRKIRKAMLGLGLAVLAAPVTGVVPAVAATLPVGTVNAVAEQSPTDTRPVKTFSAHCPAGQRVAGHRQDVRCHAWRSVSREARHAGRP